MTFNKSFYSYKGLTNRYQVFDAVGKVNTIPTHQVMAQARDHHRQPLETTPSFPPIQSQRSPNSSVIFTQQSQQTQPYFNKRQEPKPMTAVNSVSAPTEDIAPFTNSPSATFGPKLAPGVCSASLSLWPYQTLIGSELSNPSSDILSYATTNPDSNLVQSTNRSPVKAIEPFTIARSTSGMHIRVLGIPRTGAKSRVETQIKLCIQLVTDGGNKTQQWSYLKLSEKMVTKAKVQQQQRQQQQQQRKGEPSLDIEKVLFLHARVVCASDPSRKVTTCRGCVQRERKRSQRRKSNRKLKLAATTDDNKRLLIFNCAELTDFSSSDTILPTRITCYCRHHNEHLGFCIHFEMRDWNGKHVATGMSPPIMITDDHKSSNAKQKRSRNYRTYLPSNDSDDSALSHVVSSPSTSTSALSPSLSSSPSSSSSPSLVPTPTSYTRFRLKHLGFMNDMSPPPRVHRIIPNTGSVTGGDEVTVLGSGCLPNQTCLFGGVPTQYTPFWSPNVLVCAPPPTPPGTVAVEIQTCHSGGDEGSHSFFTYNSPIYT